jgi:hypothetical protein
MFLSHLKERIYCFFCSVRDMKTVVPFLSLNAKIVSEFFKCLGPLKLPTVETSMIMCVRSQDSSTICITLDPSSFGWTIPLSIFYTFLLAAIQNGATGAATSKDHT